MYVEKPEPNFISQPLLKTENEPIRAHSHFVFDDSFWIKKHTPPPVWPIIHGLIIIAGPFISLSTKLEAVVLVFLLLILLAHTGRKRPKRKVEKGRILSTHSESGYVTYEKMLSYLSSFFSLLHIIYSLGFLFLSLLSASQSDRKKNELSTIDWHCRKWRLNISQLFPGGIFF
jgi:hypothetical protein